MVNILKEFKEKIDKTNMVSKNDILSLETMLNENVVTSVKPINYFTTNSSGIGVDEVKGILENKINTVSADSVFNMHDFISDTSITLRKLRTKGKEILNSLTTLDIDVINFFNNDVYNKVYTQIGEEQVITDVKNVNLFELVFDRVFMDKLIEVASLDCDAYLSYISKATYNEDDVAKDKSKIQLVPLLNYLTIDAGDKCILDVTDYNITPLTFNLILEAKDKIGLIEENYKNLIDRIFEYTKFSNLEKLTYEDQKDISNKLNNIKSIAEQSEAYLELIELFKKK